MSNSSPVFTLFQPGGAGESHGLSLGASREQKSGQGSFLPLLLSLVMEGGRSQASEGSELRAASSDWSGEPGEHARGPRVGQWLVWGAPSSSGLESLVHGGGQAHSTDDTEAATARPATAEQPEAHGQAGGDSGELVQALLALVLQSGPPSSPISGNGTHGELGVGAGGMLGSVTLGGATAAILRPPEVAGGSSVGRAGAEGGIAAPQLTASPDAADVGERSAAQAERWPALPDAAGARGLDTIASGTRWGLPSAALEGETVQVAARAVEESQAGGPRAARSTAEAVVDLAGTTRVQGGVQADGRGAGSIPGTDIDALSTEAGRLREVGGLSSSPSTLRTQDAAIGLDQVQAEDRPQVLASRMAESIVRHARLLKVGEESIFQLRLEPPSLGRLEVRVTAAEHGIRIAVSAERPEAQQAVQAGLADLTSAIRERGIAVERTEVWLNNPESNSSGEQRSGAGAGERPRFNGPGALETPVADDGNVASAAMGGPGAVDLRV